MAGPWEKYRKPKLYQVGDKVPGMVAPGNLDLNARTVYHGTSRDTPGVDFRTENSISIGTDQGEVLIPTVVNGRQLTEDQAIEHFNRTGENLGTFESPETADAYASSLHERQSRTYAPKSGAAASDGPWSKHGRKDPFEGGGPVTPKDPNEQTQPSTNVILNGKPIRKSGVVENAQAGLNSAIYDAVGLPVDFAGSVINWGIAGANALTGQKDLTTNMIRGPVMGSKWISGVFQKIGVDDPDKVIATNLAERLSRMGGEGAGMVIAPEMMLAALHRVGVVGDVAKQFLGNVFGESKSAGAMTKNAVAGAAGGVGAEGASEAAPEPLKPLAGTLGALAGGGAGAVTTEAPAVIRTGAKLAGDYLAPITQGGRERMAGNALREGATNPGRVIDDIENSPGELVPGSRPTTFQQTGDMGLGAMERGAAAKDPAPFMQRRADQNAARMTEFEDLQSTGAPEDVVRVVRNRLDEIDRQTHAAVDTAHSDARTSAAAIGEGKSADIAGGDMRASVEAARGVAKEQERALWAAVDPDGTLALDAGRMRSAAERIPSEMAQSAKPQDGEEAAIFRAAGQVPETAPLSELTALQSRIKTEMRTERIANGESAAYRRLTQLHHAIQDDLESAIVRKVAQEQQAVAAGRMGAEDTLLAKLRDEVSSFYDARQSAAGQDGGTSLGRGGGSRSAGVSGAGGAEVPAGRRLPGGPGNSRLQENAGDQVDSGALGRLTAARAATKSRVETFDNPTLAPIRKRAGTTSPYDMPAGAVGAKIFFAGPNSFEAVQAYQKASGSMQALTDYAIGRLRAAAMREDGTLDPAKLAAWRRSHADALRAMSELDASLSNATSASEAVAAATAATKQALEEAQLGTLGKLIGVDDPEDVSRTIGRIFGRNDAAAEMKRLRSALGDNAEAKAGLRKAVVDFMVDKLVSNTEAGTSGITGLKSDQFQTFIAQNKATLKAAGFNDEEIQTLDALAADLQRANRSTASLKLPGGSNTVQDAFAAKATDSNAALLAKIILAAVASGGSATAVGGPFAGIAAALGTAAVGVLRQRGLAKVDDLIKEALLDPTLARDLMLKAKPRQANALGPSVSQRAARASLGALAAEHGQENRGNALATPAPMPHSSALSPMRAGQASAGLSGQ